jgi:hypothetical protein
MIKRTQIALAVMAIACLPVFPSASSGADGWPWPVSGEVITAYKNGNDPYAAGQHRGIDIASPVGTKVRSSVGGSVSYAGRLPDGGITVTVRSGDGQYLVSYLHLSELAVKRGESISTGGIVGKVGTTGERSAAEPHLHLSVRLASSGAYVDPLPLLGPRAVAKPPAGDSPAEAKPVEHAAPQAQTNTEAHARTEARAQSTPREHRAHRQARHRVRSRSTNPQTVHAPASGDSVSALQTGRAEDSARESHASGGNGRVAPPPVRSESPADVNLETPGHETSAIDAAERSADTGDGGGPPHLTAVLFLVVAGAIALAVRRRKSGRDEFSPPPLAHRTDLLDDAPRTDSEVVELKAFHQRA